MKNNFNSDAYTAEEAFDTKGIIRKYINEVPGIRYRELLRLTGLTNGTLEYHLKILERTHKVRVFRRNGRRAGYKNTDTKGIHMENCRSSEVKNYAHFYTMFKL